MRRRIPLLGLLLACFTLAGCLRGCTSDDPPIHLIRNMDTQPRYRAQSESRFFYDGMAMRPRIPGTVARGELYQEPSFLSGKIDETRFLTEVPLEIDANALARGREIFQIQCAPCHGRRGDGNSPTARLGKLPVPNLFDPRVSALPPGEIFFTLTQGKGLMPHYRYPLDAQARWETVAFLKDWQKRKQAETAPAP